MKFLEALAALEAGRKIRNKSWTAGFWIQRRRNTITNNNGANWELTIKGDFDVHEWELFFDLEDAKNGDRITNGGTVYRYVGRVPDTERKFVVCSLTGEYSYIINDPDGWHYVDQPFKNS